MALLLLPVASPVAAVPPDDWAWAVVRDPADPAYTLGVKDRGNSSGGAVLYERDSLGASIVIFKGLASTGGTAHVAALTESAGFCAMEGWEPDAGDLLVFIHCYSRSGAARDLPYVVSFLQVYSLTGVRGYVWANDEDAANYTPDLVYQDNSAGADNTVRRTARGRYVVTMPGLGGPGGNVQVTAYGDRARVCRVASWDEVAGDEVIRVRCRNKDGGLVDHRFTLSYVRGEGLKGQGGPAWAYLWAERESAGRYSPAKAYRRADPSGKPVITRSGVGAYDVRLPSMPLGGGVQVTPYGEGSARCNVDAIRRSGATQRIGVRCFTATGSGPADSEFSLSYAR